MYNNLSVQLNAFVLLEKYECGPCCNLSKVLIGNFDFQRGLKNSHCDSRPEVYVRQRSMRAVMSAGSGAEKNISSPVWG